MNAYELAYKLGNALGVDYTLLEESAIMLRQQHAEIESYRAVLTEIANDYPELSHDKARMQNLDHIKWAKEVLK